MYYNINIFFSLENCSKKLLDQELFTSKLHCAVKIQDNYEMETKMPMRFAPNPLCNANLQLQP